MADEDAVGNPQNRGCNGLVDDGNPCLCLRFAGDNSGQNCENCRHSIEMHRLIPAMQERTFIISQNEAKFPESLEEGRDEKNHYNSASIGEGVTKDSAGHGAIANDGDYEATNVPSASFSENKQRDEDDSDDSDDVSYCLHFLNILSILCITLDIVCDT